MNLKQCDYRSAASLFAKQLHPYRRPGPIRNYQCRANVIAASRNLFHQNMPRSHVYMLSGRTTPDTEQPAHPDYPTIGAHLTNQLHRGLHSTIQKRGADNRRVEGEKRKTPWLKTEDDTRTKMKSTMTLNYIEHE